jgi:hypothetical protein
MAITINSEQLDKGIILVNEKAIYKDANGKWIARIELTTYEYQAFKRHLEILGEPLVSC